MAQSSRIAIVTGASRRIGIGAAICRALAAQGVDIAFTHWAAYDQQMDWGEDADGPSGLAAEIRALGVRCASLEADMTQSDSAAKILDFVEAQLGAPSILVNNATYSVSDGYEKLDAAILDATYAVNMRGTFLLTVEFVKRFQAGSGGRVISLTSGQSLGPMPTELAYIATKGAVEAFTVSLSASAGVKGITVNAVDPGPTDSGWMNDELKDFLRPRFPTNRIGMPSDAAQLIAFLASEAAGWVTGQIIHSNGGFR